MLLTACGTEPPPPAGGGGAPEASAPPEASAGASASAAAPSGVAPEQPGRTVRLSYSGGQVSGDTGRVAVPLGSTVSLVVSGDQADEVHLHGYDRYLAVPAGGSATLTFTADIPGVFEVERHDAGLLLTQLEVG